MLKRGVRCGNQMFIVENCPCGKKMFVERGVRREKNKFVEERFPSGRKVFVEESCPLWKEAVC